MLIPRQSSKLSLPLMAVMTVAMGASVVVLPTSAATAAPVGAASNAGAPASVENTTSTSTAGLPSFVTRDYKMTFHDEFDGTKLDITKWGYQYGCFDPAQRSQAQYTDSPDNVSVRDGYLNLTARYSPMKTKWDGTQIPRTCKHGSVTYDAPFTSGMITTKTKDGKVLYAAPGTGFYAEARIKLPSARPSWSAFWGTGTKGAYPANGEIDVFESKGYDPTHLMSNVHTPRIGDPKKTTQHQGMMKGDTASSQSEFHTYGVRKTADAIEFYFDGTLTHTVKMSDIKGDNPFLDKDNNLVLMLNQMVGGSYLAKQSNWSDKTYVDATKYADDYKSADGAGATMYVDYVRVYEPKTEADKPAPSETPATSTPVPSATPAPAPAPTTAPAPVQPKPEPSAPTQSAQPVAPVTPAPAPTKPAPTQPTPTPTPVQPAPSQSANQSAQSEQSAKSAQPVKPQPKKPSADRKVTTIVYSRYHWVTTIWQGFRKWVITVWLW